MTMVLPTPVGSPISQWAVTDWIAPVLTSAPAAAGRATLTWPQLGSDVQWLVDHAVSQCTSTTATTMRLYDGDPTDSRALIDGTGVGNFDVADWPAGLLVRPLSTLAAVWTGCSAGAVATLRLQVRVMRLVTS